MRKNEKEYNEFLATLDFTGSIEKLMTKSKDVVNNPSHYTRKKKILYVEWIDSAGTNGWLTKEEVDSIGDIAKCCSAGFLVKETKTALVLALNGSQDGLSSPYGDIISIPLVCITKREEL